MKSKIESYIEEHIGTVSCVYHEIVSDGVHIVNEIVNLNRQNVCKKRFGLF
jgi:hypothetical protein